MKITKVPLYKLTNQLERLNKEFPTQSENLTQFEQETEEDEVQESK